MSAPTKRRLMFVYEPYQRAVLRMALGHWAIFCAAVFGMLCLLNLFSSDDPQMSLLEVVRETILHNLVLLIVLAALLPKFVWDTLKLSHRVAGPVLKLQASMRSVLAGDAPRPVQTRDSDFFPEVVADYNELLTRLPAAEQLRPKAELAATH